MPKATYAGNPTGEGNPPGKHSEGYLNNPGEKDGHFTMDSSYRGDMHVGKITENASEVGNQPKEKSEKDPSALSNKKDSI